MFRRYGHGRVCSIDCSVYLVTGVSPNLRETVRDRVHRGRGASPDPDLAVDVDDVSVGCPGRDEQRSRDLLLSECLINDPMAPWSRGGARLVPWRVC